MCLRETLPEEYFNGGGQGGGETPSWSYVSSLFFNMQGFYRAVFLKLRFGAYKEPGCFAISFYFVMKL